MYGYNQGNYGGYGTSPYANSAAVAAAASAYGSLGQATASQQQSLQNSVFGSSANSPYAGYGSSAVAAAYGYAPQPSSVAANAANYAAQAAHVQAAAVQANRLALDAYSAAAAAAPSQYPSFASAGYGGGSAQAASSFAAYGRNAVQANHSNQMAKSLAASAALSSAIPKNKLPTMGGANPYTSGYDAAVYAAASNLLQSKAATGNINGWLNKKPSEWSGAGQSPAQMNYYPAAAGYQGNAVYQRSYQDSRMPSQNKSYYYASGPERGGGGMGRGAGSWNHKRFNQQPSQPRVIQQFYCETCKISCAGQLTYKEHLEGQKHKKKENMAKGENMSIPKSKVSFRCDLCNTTCTGQDTYNAHVRGSKHQKTLNLCKTLGKPIPSTECTIIPPSEMGGAIPPPLKTGGTPIPTVGHAQQQGKRVIGISTVNFVAGAKLSTTGQLETKKQQVMAAVSSAGKSDAPIASVVKAQPEEIQALIAAEQNVQIVGESYVESEKDSNGKLIQYICKLCDCKFNDPNAKEIHLKGRRHRLQYKQKVDPNIDVDLRGQGSRRGGRFGPHGGPPTPRNMMMPPQSRPAWMNGNVGPRTWFLPGPADGRRFESVDDRHIMARHAKIYPDDNQLIIIEKLVESVENALKKVSDLMITRDSVDVKTEKMETCDEKVLTEEEQKEQGRKLKGVMRVGYLSDQLLLKCDKQVKLVVMCSQIPTKSLLNEVAQLLQNVYEYDNAPSPINVIVDEVAGCLRIDRNSGDDMQCRVAFSSRVLRDESEGTVVEPPTDSLDRDACLLALAELRHSKWFQVRCTYLQSCQVTLRVLRDLRMRIDSWAPLTDWMCELLVEKVLTSSVVPMSVGSAFRRVLEAISSGILSSTGPGLLDPCEKQREDALAPLTAQQRESITTSAQHALRLVAFNQLYKVMEIDRLPDVRAPMVDRKRPSEPSTNQEDVKKDKKEESDVSAVKMESL